MRRTRIRNWTEMLAGAVHGSGKAARTLGLAAVLGAGLLLGGCGGASTAGSGERAEAVVEEMAVAETMAIQAMTQAPGAMEEGAESRLEYGQAMMGEAWPPERRWRAGRGISPASSYGM